VIQRNVLAALPPPTLTSDVYETVDGEAYVVEMPVPGLDVTDINIEATPEMLTVRTQPRATGDNGRRYLVREQHVEPMSRVFEFPTEINPDEVTAKLEAGMLRIHVPKAAAARRRVIQLKH
jgi:HSP20 family protein